MSERVLSEEEKRYFLQEQAIHERYLTGANPRLQSGFGRDEQDWERFRRPILEPVTKDGTFLDIGCANGLLMECIVHWAAAMGHVIEPYGLDILDKLVALARQRLPAWHDRFFIGNALFWEPPFRFDFVRTEMVYVPDTRRREYFEHLLEHVVAPGGKLILCTYGSSRPEGNRVEPLLEEVQGWDVPIDNVFDVVSPEHGFVITRVISIAR